MKQSKLGAGDHRKYVGQLAGHPGPDRDAGAWLGDTGIRVTGADTFAYDRRSSTASTSWIIMCLDELAKHKAYEFMFCALPLRFLGGNGSPIRPIAMF